EWSDELSAIEFVRSRWPFRSDPSTRLANGDIFLFMDGLNEMGATGSDKAKLLRAWLRTEAAPQRLILTCRLEDYSAALRCDDLPMVIALSMNDAQIAAFAGRYLGEETKDFLDQILYQGESLEVFAKREAAVGRSLIHLARNPFLLSALIYIYQHSRDRAGAW